MQRRLKHRSLVSNFLNLTPRQRRKVQLCSNEIVKEHTVRPIIFTSREEIIDSLLKNHIQTSYDLENRLKTDKTLPSMYYIKKYFGSWTKLSLELYGKMRLRVKKSDTDILRVISEFNIFTLKEYEEKSKQHPDLFLSKRAVIDRFGSWENARIAAYKTSIKSLLEQYIALKMRLRCWPTVQECMENGIDFYILTNEIPLKELKCMVRFFEKRKKHEK